MIRLRHDAASWSIIYIYIYIYIYIKIYKNIPVKRLLLAAKRCAYGA